MSEWRKLTESEIRTLAERGNTADNWDDILVAGNFDATLVSRSHFSGECRIALGATGLRKAGGLELPVGISNSRIRSCTIADGCAIHDVRFLSGYGIGNDCLLFNIGQMTAEGGFSAPVIEVMNENGSRRVHSFPGMRCSDAFLMAAWPEDCGLQQRLEAFSKARRLRPEIAAGCAITNVPRIERLQCGPACTIDCAVSIDSVCVCSTAVEPVHIDGSCVLRNGIVGPGNRISGGCIAENFATGAGCTLSGGVRFFNSVLGDNSTVSCCELVCSLIFPAHEQHHNNSFLIAACVGGQSNIAAGATVGSNHNGRTADGEIVAGRGFWPGLCVSLKHSSVFACHTMLAKGAYPAELSIPLPFCLVANNAMIQGEIQIVPDCRMDDGVLDVIVVETSDTTQLLKPLAFGLVDRSGKSIGRPHIESFRGAHITIESSEPAPIEIDGEVMPGLTRRYEARALPGAARIVVDPMSPYGSADDGTSRFGGSEVIAYPK